MTFSQIGLGHLLEETAKYVTGSLLEREESPQPSELGSPGDEEQGVGSVFRIQLLCDFTSVLMRSEVFRWYTLPGNEIYLK